MCTWRRLTVLLLIACVPWSGARAQQLPAGPITTAQGTVTVGGEVTVTAGSRDDIAFFNYTDYEHNALRMFRVSLSGMWRPASRLAFLTELRSEDAQRVIPYALYVRVRPWKARPFVLQAGRIPPVFGAFARRSYGADNPLIGYPLAYQYLTSIRPDALPATADDLLVMRARGWRANYPIGVTDPGPGVPLVSAYRWDTGVQAHAAGDHVEAAIALTTGTLSNPRVDVRAAAGAAEMRPDPGSLGMAASRDPLDRRRSVVYLETAPRAAFEVSEERRARMDQRNERFVPHVLAIVAGTWVDFPNDDRTYHNVFSLSKTKEFNLGRYAAGRSQAVRFERPGIVRVFCEIHSHMSGFILVFAHRYFAVTDDDGRYRLEGVPPGTYTVAVWNETVRGDPPRRTVTIAETGGDVDTDFTIR